MKVHLVHALYLVPCFLASCSAGRSGSKTPETVAQADVKLLSMADIEGKFWKTPCQLYRPAESGDQPVVQKVTFSSNKLVVVDEAYEAYKDPECKHEPLEIHTNEYTFALQETRELPSNISSEGGGLFLFSKMAKVKEAKLLSSKLKYKAAHNASFGYDVWNAGEEKDVLNRVEVANLSYVPYKAGQSFCNFESLKTLRACWLLLDETQNLLAEGFEHDDSPFIPFLAAQMLFRL